jgi:serine/threonine protein phosphatase 1
MAAGDDILAVGDLHGRYDLLERVLDDLAPRYAGSRLVFLGDYIDRGPNSRQVVERLIALGRERPDTVFLKGNHEDMLLDALDGRRLELWLHNGGLETLESYGLAGLEPPGPETLSRLPADHLEFFRGLRLYFESQSYLLVHAGVDPGLGLAEQDARDLLWIREHFHQARGHRLGKTVVFGHTPFPRPFRGPGMIGIDTGAVYDNALTCVKLPEEEFHRLPAQP